MDQQFVKKKLSDSDVRNFVRFFDVTNFARLVLRGIFVCVCINKSRFQGILRRVEVGDNDDDVGGWSA